MGPRRAVSIHFRAAQVIRPLSDVTTISYTERYIQLEEEGTL
jgi:hypothetical protein